LSGRRGNISAVIPAFGKPETLAVTLDHLSEVPVDETIVVDNGSSREIRDLVAGRFDHVKLIVPERNLGIAARNLATREATGEFILSLDDDSYPLPGAVEAMRDALQRNPAAGVVAGLMNEQDRYGRALPDDEVGAWDWWLRCGQKGDPPAEGFESNSFAEGAAMFRREAFLEVGAWFEPFFHLISELDLAIRLIDAGWEIRYLPGARFEHMKGAKGPQYFQRSLYYRTRNELWYYWLRFPAWMAIRRIPVYILYFLAESLFRRQPGAWARGVRDAWSQRSRVSGSRRPLPRSVVRKAERDHGRRVIRVMLRGLTRRLPGSSWRSSTDRTSNGRLAA
jgi:N-acetylglucosaminyl-diphospho-decaprenol L-rhamnosyltransferase